MSPICVVLCYSCCAGIIRYSCHSCTAADPTLHPGYTVRLNIVARDTYFAKLPVIFVFFQVILAVKMVVEVLSFILNM